MDELLLTGMTLKEARGVLKQKGIIEYKVVVTSPPRSSGMEAEEDFRVLLVYPNDTPMTVLVCKP
ncbi:MAG TPA: hypothetical protein VFD00_09140 [Thermoclostridium sp.]|nr:hypothetical protein [Thermoclostridium sp.]